MKRKESVSDLVTVIIPVYNVEPYLEQCLLSVAGQTYKNLEILIVYDESTDKSIEICEKWKRDDSRVKLIINSQRGGLGAARNLGLDAAAGKYLTFLDSDDWMDKDYIQKMYAEMVSSNADFVSDCAYWEVSEEGEVCRWSVPPGTYNSTEMKELLIYSGRVTMWKKLYKKEWLIHNRLYQPVLFYYEDWGTFPLMVRMADSIKVAPIGGVKYRMRENSLSNDNEIKIVQGLSDSMSHLLSSLSKNGLLKKNDLAIMFYCYRDYTTRYLQYSCNKLAVQALENLKDTLLDKWFPAFLFPSRECYIVGGFQLRWEYQASSCYIERNYKHFCFSSLIAMMSDGPSKDIEHKNSFRRQALIDDTMGEFRKCIRNLKKNDILFLDFLEERYDIVKWDTDCYSTFSDAFRESNLGDGDYVKITYGSPEFWMLWENKCDLFIKKLKEKLPGKQVVLVKNRMSTHYGDFDKRTEFRDVDSIEYINSNIRKMELYFLSQYKDVTIIEPQQKYMFAAPFELFDIDSQYTNNLCYSQVGFDIFHYIRNLNLSTLENSI